LTLATDGTVCTSVMLDLLEAFDAQRVRGAPATRMSLRRLRPSEAWDALAAGDADLVIGILGDLASQDGVDVRPLGEVNCPFVVASHHPLARAVEPISDDVRTRHRAVAVDAPNRAAVPANRGLLPGQEVLTVWSIEDQIEVLLRGLACGFVPESMVWAELSAGLLVRRDTEYKPRCVRLGYAWRRVHRMQVGLALQWWLDRLDDVGTRLALAEWRSRPNATVHTLVAQKPFRAARRPIECAAPSLI
jgi:DNA-binding transcriptional LysR family regulator